MVFSAKWRIDFATIVVREKIKSRQVWCKQSGGRLHACLSPGGDGSCFSNTSNLCIFYFFHIAQLARFLVWLCYHEDKDVCLFRLYSLWIPIFCINWNKYSDTPVPMAMHVNMLYCNMIQYRLYPYLVMMQLIKFIAQPTPPSKEFI
jgi:hypothetical protein